MKIAALRLLNMIIVGGLALVLLNSTQSSEAPFVDFVAGLFSIVLLGLFVLLAIQISNTESPAEVTVGLIADIRNLRKTIEDDAAGREMWRLRLEEALERAKLL